MAKPEFYPDWATTDTTLPSTGNVNKVRPKQTLREVGVDYGQLLTAEETNWLFNNTGAWVRYLADEYLDTIPLTYLPKDGTALTFTGDISGTAQWTGTNTGSVTLTSAMLTAATSANTPDTLVKRSSTGGISIGRAIAGYAPTGQNFDYQMYDGITNVQTGAVAWSRSDGVVTIYKGTTGGQVQWIRMYDDRTEISNPRSSSSQGANVADLTRRDYVDGQDNALETNLKNYVDAKTIASFGQNGYWKDVNTGTIIQWGWANNVHDDEYITVTLPITFPTSFFVALATPKFAGTVTDSAGLGAHTTVINTSSFGLGATDSGVPPATIDGAYWIAIGR